MAQREKFVTTEEFETFVHLPANRERLFERIGGRIVEVVSNNYSSEIGGSILAEIRMFIKGKNIGRVTGADGGFVIGDEHYIPDVAFISINKQPEPSREAYNPNHPDLVVEVLSPSNSPRDMRIKTVNYLNIGAIVWLVDPEAQQVEVYVPGEMPYTVGIDGILDGGHVIPGFKLPVRDIFTV
jgi:Uma2 family endonuclease